MIELIKKNKAGINNALQYERKVGMLSTLTHLK